MLANSANKERKSVYPTLPTPKKRNGSPLGALLKEQSSPFRARVGSFILSLGSLGTLVVQPQGKYVRHSLNLVSPIMTPTVVPI